MKRFFWAIVLMLLSFAAGAQDGYIHYRGSLVNAMHAIVVQKKATVAFLGGSITEMRGWHNMVMEDLRQKFPDTEFDFIEAGIASLGSTPHAFRFGQDVLGHGMPDLLFVEAAVNDDTNEFTPRAQVRGMEGIVRQALEANPCMDIVMLHFIYDPFLPLLASGEQPDVIMNHERVANRYHVTSINLAQEISDKMAAGELTWEQFGGTHPAPLGHRCYAATIGRMFDACAASADAGRPVPHALPAPLDGECYQHAHFVPVTEARSLKGFSIVESWRAEGKIEYRPGFVDVPMLSADHGGSFVFKFEGRAVGIFAVCGPDSAKIRYRVDKGQWKTLDTYTHWSRKLYLPWTYVLAEDLVPGSHVLQVRVDDSERGGLHIRNFLVND